MKPAPPAAPQAVAADRVRRGEPGLLVAHGSRT